MATDLYADYPELAAQESAIERRRKIAQAMLESSGAPLKVDQVAGGRVIPVSPFQGIAQLAQSYLANKNLKGLDEESSGLVDSRKKIVSDAIMEYKGLKKASALTPETGDDLDAYRFAVTSNVPEVRDLGTFEYGVDKDAAEAAAKVEAARVAAEEKAELKRMEIESRNQIAADQRWQSGENARLMAERYKDPPQKLNKDQRHTEQGTVEFIPGSKGESEVVKNISGAPVALGTILSIKNYVDNLKENKEGLTDAVGKSSVLNPLTEWTSGVIGSDDRVEFLKDLKNIEDSGFTVAITAIRGLGSLSNAEGKALVGAFTNLKTSTTEESFKDNLKIFESRLQSYEEAVKNDLEQNMSSLAPESRAKQRKYFDDAYARIQGEIDPKQPSGAAPPFDPSSLTPEEINELTPEERAALGLPPKE